ncbi:uncharacterized protein AMSG_07070 [Thecamonas trahens ATCC 50062]|uniref:Uncharacterized protein n=1 Tax=Thecamonas trahens ATCC 50062 TaxID=461836 RepID=A0A0L0DG41_THETB|nr:hypothetical protein AMSG_07070 [Thecamonas trahens ATCC 50062]KNC51081.1 hypothetical protein AMSG_07070 [Thecamonas trahens ATCC 50062]|eukprot:XP_013756537.1 hypothetical protein AMSG_07070 [Thecamonas trahens ATCC 50062]
MPPAPLPRLDTLPAELVHAVAHGSGVLTAGDVVALAATNSYLHAALLGDGYARALLYARAGPTACAARGEWRAAYVALTLPLTPPVNRLLLTAVAASAAGATADADADAAPWRELVVRTCARHALFDPRDSSYLVLRRALAANNDGTVAALVPALGADAGVLVQCKEALREAVRRGHLGVVRRVLCSQDDDDHRVHLVLCLVMDAAAEQKPEMVAALIDMVPDAFTSHLEQNLFVGMLGFQNVVWAPHSPHAPPHLPFCPEILACLLKRVGPIMSDKLLVSVLHVSAACQTVLLDFMCQAQPELYSAVAASMAGDVDAVLAAIDSADTGAGTLAPMLTGIAGGCGQTEVVRALVARLGRACAPVACGAIVRAAGCGHADALQLLLELASDASNTHRMALHAAAAAGQAKALEVVLATTGCEVNNQAASVAALYAAVGSGCASTFLTLACHPHISPAACAQVALEGFVSMCAAGNVSLASAVLPVIVNHTPRAELRQAASAAVAAAAIAGAPFMVSWLLEECGLLIDRARLVEVLAAVSEPAVAEPLAAWLVAEAEPANADEPEPLVLAPHLRPRTRVRVGSRARDRSAKGRKGNGRGMGKARGAAKQGRPKAKAKGKGGAGKSSRRRNRGLPVGAIPKVQRTRVEAATDTAVQLANGTTVVPTSLALNAPLTTWIGLRFRLEVGASDEVAAAVLSLVPAQTTSVSSACAVVIHVENSATPAPFGASDGGVLSGRSRAPPVIPWTLPGTTDVCANGQLETPTATSPDLTPLLDHVRALPGWTAGGHVALLIAVPSSSCKESDGGARQFAGYVPDTTSWYGPIAAPMLQVTSMCADCASVLTFPASLPPTIFHGSQVVFTAGSSTEVSVDDGYGEMPLLVPLDADSPAAAAAFELKVSSGMGTAGTVFAPTADVFLGHALAQPYVPGPGTPVVTRLAFAPLGVPPSGRIVSASIVTAAANETLEAGPLNLRVRAEALDAVRAAPGAATGAGADISSRQLGSADVYWTMPSTWPRGERVASPDLAALFNQGSVLNSPGSSAVDKTALHLEGSGTRLIAAGCSELDIVPFLEGVSTLMPVDPVLTLDATGGTLTLATSSGILFTTGDGTADTRIVASATESVLNAALNGLRFDPTPSGGSHNASVCATLTRATVGASPGGFSALRFVSASPASMLDDAIDGSTGTVSSGSPSVGFDSAAPFYALDDGLFRGYLDLAGILPGDSVTLPAALYAVGHRDLSLSLWMRVNAPTFHGVAQPSILQRGPTSPTSGSPGWALALDANSETIVFTVSDGAVTPTATTISADVSTELGAEAWFHIGALYSATFKVLRLYINGIPAPLPLGTAALSDAFLAEIATAGGFAPATVIGGEFDGHVADIRAFTVTLPPQFFAHLAQGVSGTTTTACVGTLTGRVTNATMDDCGVCDGQNEDKDDCGVCFGGGAAKDACAGCDGVPNSGLVFDVCGVCGGDGGTCIGCNGLPMSNGGAIVDACGVCAGGATSCNTTCAPGGMQYDCLGVCGGDARTDGCGVCWSAADSLAFADLHRDECGICFGNNSLQDTCGVCGGGNADVDACGVCFGGGQGKDRCGVCFGQNYTVDVCGVCFGDSRSCLGCDGHPSSGLELNACGVCGGGPCGEAIAVDAAPSPALPMILVASAMVGLFFLLCLVAGVAIRARRRHAVAAATSPLRPSGPALFVAVAGSAATTIPVGGVCIDTWHEVSTYKTWQLDEVVRAVESVLDCHGRAAVALDARHARTFVESHLVDGVLMSRAAMKLVEDRLAASCSIEPADSLESNGGDGDGVVIIRRAMPVQPTIIMAKPSPDANEPALAELMLQASLSEADPPKIRPATSNATSRKRSLTSRIDKLNSTISSVPLRRRSIARDAMSDNGLTVTRPVSSGLVRHRSTSDPGGMEEAALAAKRSLLKAASGKRNRRRSIAAARLTAGRRRNSLSVSSGTGTRGTETRDELEASQIDMYDSASSVGSIAFASSTVSMAPSATLSAAASAAPTSSLPPRARKLSMSRTLSGRRSEFKVQVRPSVRSGATITVPSRSSRSFRSGSTKSITSGVSRSRSRSRSGLRDTDDDSVVSSAWNSGNL